MNKIRRQDKVLGWGKMHSGKQVKLMLFAEILNPRLLRNKTLKRKTNKYEFFFRNKFIDESYERFKYQHDNLERFVTHQ